MQLLNSGRNKEPPNVSSSILAGLAGSLGFLSLMGSILAKDELRIEIEEAMKKISSRRASIDHWSMLMRGYSEAIRLADDDDAKKEGRVQTNMLRYCIEETEREIIDLEAWLESKRPELEKREKNKRDAEDDLFKRLRAAEEETRKNVALVADLSLRIAKLTSTKAP